MHSVEPSRFRYGSPLLFQPCNYLGSPRKIYNEFTPTHASKLDQEAVSQEIPSTACDSIDYVLYVIILIQGLAHVFATNAMMTSSYFFLSRASGSLFGHLTMDILIVILCSAKVLFLCFSSALSTLFSPYTMLVYSQLGKGTVLLSISILALLSKAEGNLFIVIIVTLGFNSAILSAVSFLSIFSILSQFHMRYIHAYYNGQGIAGMLTCCFKLMTMTMTIPLPGFITYSSTYSDSGVFLYFLCSSLIVYLAFFLLFMKKNSFQSCSLAKVIKKNTTESVQIFNLVEKGVSANVIPVENDTKLYFESGGCSPPFAVVSPQIKYEALAESVVNHQQALSEQNVSWLADYLRVYHEVKIYFWCIIFHFLEVIFLVPNFLYMVKPSSSSAAALSAYGFLSHETYPIITFLFYNIGDVFGRFILRFPSVSLTTKKGLILATSLSMLFVPLFLLSNVSDTITHGRMIKYPIPRLLADDACFLLIVCSFGFISGYISLNLLMIVPQVVKNDSDRRTASILCVYGLSFALLAGSLTSLVLKIALLFYYG